MPYRSNARGLLSLAVAGLVALAVAGCGKADATTPSLSPEDAAALDQPSRFPVAQEWRFAQAWSSPAEYYASSYELYQRATQVCMEDEGFDYQPVAFWNSDLIFIRMNPLNEAVAEQFGYHTPEPASVDPAADRDAAFREALMSVEGCGNAALAFVYEGPAASRFSTEFDSLVQSATNAVAGFSATATSEQLIQRWSSCMRTRGDEYANPEEPFLRYSDGTLSSTEVATRLADLRCDTEAGLTRARSEYERARLDGWFEVNAEPIEWVMAYTAAAQLEAEQRSLDLTDRGASALHESS